MIKNVQTITSINEAAKLIWSYHHLHHTIHKADAIFILGSMDTRVATRGAELYKLGYGDYVIISGGLGKLTINEFSKPEAQTFKAILLAEGVPESKIIIEDKSTNTGENIIFTYRLLKELSLNFKSFILVQKPYMERRTYATFKKQWPEADTEVQVTSPSIEFEDYFNEPNNKELVLNVMVGDLQRIKEYPRLGFQIEQEIPDDVWSAFKFLVRKGYTSHLISSK